MTKDEIQQKIEELKQRRSEITKKIQYEDTRQYTVKILINSIN